jgi:hypothetical protein
VQWPFPSVCASFLKVKSFRILRALALLALLGPVPGRADVLPRYSGPESAAWWRANPTFEAWHEAGNVLLHQCRQHYNPARVDTWGREYRGWYDLARWTQLLTAEEFSKIGLTEKEFVAMSQSDGLIGTVLGALHPKDNVPKVFSVLGQLWKKDPEGVRDYPQLATAFAVVWDTPSPHPWPHHQVSRQSILRSEETVADRFQEYAGLDRAGRLDFRFRDLTANELVFVVDSGTPSEELKWAREKHRANLTNFDRVFFEVPYDSRRLMAEEFVWPPDRPYRLATILKEGGICVDQAYFAVTVGKARGIPTLFFVGQGREGGHAWMGYLKRNRTWDLDVGRYASQNYPVGNAFHPQTWDVVRDSELLQFAANVQRNTYYPDAEWLMGWAKDNTDQPFYGETVELARSTLPAWIDPWRARAEWLKQTGAPLEEQRDFLRAWALNFPRMPDFKVEAQERLAAVLEKMGDLSAAQSIAQEIIRQNRRKRFDLGIGQAVGGLLDRLDQKDWRGADLEFRRITRQFDEQSGGSLFYQVVKPYIETLMEEGQQKLARDALAHAMKSMPASPSSILSMEFARLQEKVNGS